MNFINGALADGRLSFQIARGLALMHPGNGVVLVIAALLYLGQLSSQTGDHDCFDWHAGPSGARLDAVMNQMVERVLTDAVAANNEKVNALFTQPAGKRTRFMRRLFDDLCANNTRLCRSASTSAKCLDSPKWPRRRPSITGMAIFRNMAFQLQDYYG